MNSAIYGRAMGNLKNRFDVKLVSNNSKMYTKTKLYVAQNIWW